MSEKIKVTASQKDIEDLISTVKEDSRHATRRWRLVVGSANAAGLAGVATKLIDLASKPIDPAATVLVHALYAAAVFFALGVLAAGLGTLMDAIRAYIRLSKLNAVLMAMRTGKSAHMSYAGLGIGELVSELLFEVMAAAFFLWGLFLPLNVIVGGLS